MTEIQIQSLILVGILFVAITIVGAFAIYLEREEERKKARRIMRRLNHERNYGNVYDRF
jgi:hypothetical protein